MRTRWTILYIKSLGVCMAHSRGSVNVHFLSLGEICKHHFLNRMLVTSPDYPGRMILLIEKWYYGGGGVMLLLFLLCLVKHLFWLMFSVGQGWFEMVSVIVSGLSRKENRDRLLISVTGTEWGNAGTHAVHISSHLCILLYSPWYNTSTWCILLFPSRSFQACLSSWEIRSSFALEMLLTFCDWSSE